MRRCRPGSIAERFGDVGGADALVASEIADGARDVQCGVGVAESAA